MKAPVSFGYMFCAETVTLVPSSSCRDRGERGVGRGDDHVDAIESGGSFGDVARERAGGCAAMVDFQFPAMSGRRLRFMGVLRGPFSPVFRGEAIAFASGP